MEGDTTNDVDDRLVQVLVCDRDVLAMLNWRRHEFIALPAIADVPSDAVVTAVNWDYNCRAFVLTLRHPSFARVPKGDLIPRLPFGTLETCVFRIPTGPQLEAPRIVDVLPDLRAKAREMGYLPDEAPAPKPPPKSWEFLGPPR